jgi:sucrose phosphorylase
LNITWFDALNDPAKQEPDLDVQRFLASQAIMLSLAGVPGIYIHSLLGSRNCTDCLVKTGQARSINREKYLLTKLDQELSDSDNLKSRVLKGYRHLLYIRKQQFAFHPAASQRVLSLSPDVFATLRQAETGAKLLCVTNVTPKFLDLEIDLSKLGLQKNAKWVDLLRVNTYFTHDAPQINLAPYQYRWLKMEP